MTLGIVSHLPVNYRGSLSRERRPPAFPLAIWKLYDITETAGIGAGSIGQIRTVALLFIGVGMRSIIVLFSIFFLSQFASVATIHVPADQPTIQGRINAAVPGDTVLAAPQAYAGVINFSGKSVKFPSSHGPEPCCPVDFDIN